MQRHPGQVPNSLAAPLDFPAPHLRPVNEELPGVVTGYLPSRTLPASERDGTRFDRYWGSALGLLVGLCLALAVVVWWLLLTLP